MAITTKTKNDYINHSCDKYGSIYQVVKTILAILTILRIYSTPKEFAGVQKIKIVGLKIVTRWKVAPPIFLHRRNVIGK